MSFLVLLSLFVCALADPSRLWAEQCARDCRVCEAMVAPKLRAVHQYCPDCACARQLVNASQPACPRPPASSGFCLQGAAVDARGCPTGQCAPSAVPFARLVGALASCGKMCAGGYVRDAKSGVPQCRCVCPLEEVPPSARWQLCAKRCAGGRFSVQVNASSGCQECVCVGKPAPPCPALQCTLHCPAGLQLDKDGCPACKCQAKSACPAVGCNEECGPHQVARTHDANGCLVGCQCRCTPLQCPATSGQCERRRRDQFGCPTCECEDSDGAQPLQEVMACPEAGSGPAELVCPDKCPGLRMYDGERNCEMCHCCPKLQESCPALQCETQQVDRWGCLMCACAESPKTSER